MVQITNALIAVALIVPALAAPAVVQSRDTADNDAVLEAREPRFGGGFGGRGGGHGPRRRSLTSDESTLEAREPRIPVNGIGHPAYQTHTSLRPGLIIGREVEAREPRRGFGGGFRHGGHGMSGAPQQRDFDDSQVEAREPRRGFGGGFRHGGHGMSGAPQQRDFDDNEIEVREPRRGFGGGFRHGGHGMGAPQQRDFDDSEIEARAPRFNVNSGLPFPLRRKIARDDIEAREPIRGFRGGRGFRKHFGHGMGAPQPQEQQQRDFEDEQIATLGRRRFLGHGPVVNHVKRTADSEIDELD